MEFGKLISLGWPILHAQYCNRAMIYAVVLVPLVVVVTHSPPARRARGT